MLLSSIGGGKRSGAVITTLLLVAGLYTSVSWFLGYVWAGVWNKGALQNTLSIVIGLFFGLIWIGFLFSRKSVAVYWASIGSACLVAAALIWDQVGGKILPLRVEILDIAFTLIALSVVVLRRSFTGPGPTRSSG